MIRLLILTAGLYLGPWMARAGEIRGRVKVGQALSKKRVTLPAYQLRGGPMAAPASQSGPIDEMSRIVVYLEGSGLSRGEPVTVEIKQSQRRFEPDLLVVPEGSTVSFPNRDSFFHNVFSLSRIKEFDLGSYSEGQTRTVQFDKAGVAQIYCHLHPNMSASILVVPNRFYARPERDGTFSMTGVPGGRYRLVVWHKSVGTGFRRVEVADNGAIDVEFSVPVFEPDSGR